MSGRTGKECGVQGKFIGGEDIVKNRWNLSLNANNIEKKIETNFTQLIRELFFFWTNYLYETFLEYFLVLLHFF